MKKGNLLIVSSSSEISCQILLFSQMKIFNIYILSASSFLFTGCLTFKPIARFTPNYHPPSGSPKIQKLPQSSESSSGPFGIPPVPGVTLPSSTGDIPNIQVRKSRSPEDAKLNEWEEAIKPWLNTPYRYGGMSASGIDCSGFSTMIFLEVLNYQLPRRAIDQSALGNSVNKDQLKTGDLVFFQIGKSRAISHVGIYLDNGKFAHASTSKGVIYSDLDDPYYSSTYRGAKRIRP